LNAALVAAGVDSRMYVINRSVEDPRVLAWRLLPWLPEKAARLVYRACRRLQNPVRCADDNTIFSMDWTCYGAQPMWQMPACDVINLHWVVNLLDYRAMLPALAERSPLVWTLHDMNVFTGGCHYASACEGFTDECGNCPKLATSHRHDRSYGTLKRKRGVFAAVPHSRLHIVTPTRWLAGASQRSALLGRFNHSVIPAGVDLEQFQPFGREEARAALGLRAEERVVLFVADLVIDQRKGFAQLLEAITHLRSAQPTRIVTIGRGDLSQLSSERFLHVGMVRDPRRMASIYSAADVFVIPSLQDNLPNTILEAMACGTPVVGFHTGGIAEAVIHGATGLLAPLGDTAELARHITTLLTDPALNRRMRAAARERAVAEYDVRIQARRYRALYESLLAPGDSYIESETPVPIRNT
jgi:glycosyltransferase involved in cell wall biosynthesis